MSESEAIATARRIMREGIPDPERRERVREYMREVFTQVEMFEATAALASFVGYNLAEYDAGKLTMSDEGRPDVKLPATAGEESAERNAQKLTLACMQLISATRLLKDSIRKSRRPGATYH